MERLSTPRAQKAVREDCIVFGGKVGCPPANRNFQGEVAQLVAGTSLGE